MSNISAFLYSLFAAAQDKFEGREDRGATAVEYGLLVGLIAVAIIVTVGVLGDQLNALFETVSDALPAAP